MWFFYRWLEPNFVTQMCGGRERERESNSECECDVQFELWTDGNKRLDCAISLATVMSSSEGLPYIQHNNKNDLEASGSHFNVDSNKDENESSSNTNTKIENASILDTVPFDVELHQHGQSGHPPRHGLRPREDVHSRHQSQLWPLTRYQHRSLQYRRAPRLHQPKVPFYFSQSTFIWLLSLLIGVWILFIFCLCIFSLLLSLIEL